MITTNVFSFREICLESDARRVNKSASVKIKKLSVESDFSHLKQFLSSTESKKSNEKELALQRLVKTPSTDLACIHHTLC